MDSQSGLGHAVGVNYPFRYRFGLYIVLSLGGLISFGPLSAAQSTPNVSKPVYENSSVITAEEMAVKFDDFKQAIRPPYDVKPTHKFKVTYTTFRKKVDKDGNPLIKYRGEFFVDPEKGEDERVTLISQSNAKRPQLVQDDLDEFKTRDIGEGFYCGLGREIMDALDGIDDFTDLDFQSTPSLPGQVSFNFKMPPNVVLSQNKDRTQSDENDPVMSRLIGHTKMEFNLEQNTFRPVSIRALIDEPFNISAIARMRAFDAIATCGVAEDGTLYAKEVLSFARWRIFGIGQRIHQIRALELMDKVSALE